MNEQTNVCGHIPRQNAKKLSNAQNCAASFGDEMSLLCIFEIEIWVEG
jgi:hypothetical protein